MATSCLSVVLDHLLSLIRPSPVLARTRFVSQVDLVVEIRSDSGEYQYVGPQLKVRRTPGPARVQRKIYRSKSARYFARVLSRAGVFLSDPKARLFLSGFNPTRRRSRAFVF